MSSPHKKLSLVIPCYNEEKTLIGIVEEVLKLKSEELDLELVIVDDCSTDKSLDIAADLEKKHPEIRLCRHERNQGKGAALRTGFLAATGDFIGIQDADLEYNPMDYLTMLRPMISGEADIVLGSRYLKKGTRRVLRWWHTFMNRFLTLASNIFSDVELTDMETCYKLFSRETIKTIAPLLKENRFGFEPEVVAILAQGVHNRGWRLMECAIDYRPRTFSEGKKIGWKDGVRALYCIIKYNFKTIIGKEQA